VLSFAMEGFVGEDPDALADWMQRVRERAYVPRGDKRPGLDVNDCGVRASLLLRRGLVIP
jgi:hypothetical protein